MLAFFRPHRAEPSLLQLPRVNATLVAFSANSRCLLQLRQQQQSTAIEDMLRAKDFQVVSFTKARAQTICYPHVPPSNQMMRNEVVLRFQIASWWLGK